MRENDDVTPGTGVGSLAEGLGETAEPGSGSSTSGPFGEDGFDDTYDDGTDGGFDDTYDDGTDGGFGDGDVAGSDPDETLDPADTDIAGGFGDAGLDGVDLPAQGASPIEGIGYLIDQVREALFGSDDDAVVSAFEADSLASGPEPDPADPATGGDLAQTGDGSGGTDPLDADSPVDLGDG